MAFNNVGMFFLAANDAPIRIGLKFNGAGKWDDPGDDRGAIWIMADPIPVSPRDIQFRVALVVSESTKVLDMIGGAPIDIIGSDGATKTGHIGGRRSTEYWVTVRNDDATGTSFTLQGGGNQ